MKINQDFYNTQLHSYLCLIYGMNGKKFAKKWQKVMSIEQIIDQKWWKNRDQHSPNWRDGRSHWEKQRGS